MIPRENFLQKHFITPLSHTLCDVKNFFQLDFNNPAVNTFFTATKIFSHSRFINGWYIGKLFYSFYFINLALPPFGQTKNIFTSQLYNSRITHIVCNEKTFLIFLLLFQIYHSQSVHHLNTREIFLCKNFINTKSSAFELFKKIHKKITQHKLSYFLYKLLNFIY